MLRTSRSIRIARSITCWPAGVTREVAPVAHEDLKPELVLEQLDLLVDAGL
jgi:hypothetical protein